MWAFAAMLALALATGAGAQNFALDWWTTASSGASSGGAYAVSGTLGQPDAGQMEGERYLLASGFWALTFAPRPALTIRSTALRLVIAWPNRWEGFALEESVDVAKGAWSPVAIAPVTVGDEQRVILPLPSSGPAKFYRLRKPEP